MVEEGPGAWLGTDRDYTYSEVRHWFEIRFGFTFKPENRTVIYKMIAVYGTIVAQLTRAGCFKLLFCDLLLTIFSALDKTLRHYCRREGPRRGSRHGQQQKAY
jgi:hypothetical protein